MHSGTQCTYTPAAFNSGCVLRTYERVHVRERNKAVYLQCCSIVANNLFLELSVVVLTALYSTVCGNDTKGVFCEHR